MISVSLYMKKGDVNLSKTNNELESRICSTLIDYLASSLHVVSLLFSLSLKISLINPFPPLHFKAQLLHKNYFKTSLFHTFPLSTMNTFNPTYTNLMINMLK